MKAILFAVAAVVTTSVPSFAQYYGGYGTGSNSQSHSTSGYYNQNSGAYVQPHYQTNPNNTTLDNYGTRGNYNPYTGRTGTRNPY
jgi:hypothetical protein